MLKDYTRFEKILLVSGIAITLFVSIYNKSDIFASITSLSNIINAVLTSKGKISNYIVGYIGTATYIVVCFKQHYYSEIIFNLLISTPINTYGLISWIKSSKSTGEIKMVKLSKKQILIPVLSQVVMGVGYYYVLKYFNNDMLLISTILMCLSILAFYFMAKADPIFEYFFLVANVLRTIIWVVPMFEGDFSNVPILVSQIYYFIADLYGLFLWKKKAAQQASQSV